MTRVTALERERGESIVIKRESTIIDRRQILENEEESESCCERCVVVVCGRDVSDCRRPNAYNLAGCVVSERTKLD